MTKIFLGLALAIGLGALASSAYAGLPCPWNDKQLPEGSKICKGGRVNICRDGQWSSLGTKCSARLREDVGAAKLRRVLGEPRAPRAALLARIAAAS